MKIKVDFIFQFFILSLITLGVYVIFIDFSRIKLNTADASTYLNIAQNIADGKGCVVSYNLYQHFKSLYYPIWSYMQPIYPLLCSLFIGTSGFEGVIKINILILGLNAAVVFYILQRFFTTRLNVIFLLWLIISYNFYITSFLAWTEQLHLLFFLITFILFLRNLKSSKDLFWIGALNALGVLIRFAHVYHIFGYVLGIFVTKDSWKVKIVKGLCFLGGFILVFGIYQVFCFVSSGHFYAEYLQSAVNYTRARSISEIVYNESKVGIFLSPLSIFQWKNLLFFIDHLNSFWKQLPIFTYLLFLYFFITNDRKNDNGFVVNSILQSFIVIIAYSFNLCWHNSVDSLRYSVIPFVLLSISGWYCFFRFFSNFRAGAVVFLCLLLLISINVNRYLELRQFYLSHYFIYRKYHKDLFDSYAWINSNLPVEVLISSDEDQEAYFLKRPFISTPVGRSLTCPNLSLYHKIYNPDYYLLSKRISDVCFSSMSLKRIYVNDTFRVLKVLKH